MAIERDLEQVHERGPLGRKTIGDRRNQPAVASHCEQVLMGMADKQRVCPGLKSASGPASMTSPMT